MDWDSVSNEGNYPIHTYDVVSLCGLLACVASTAVAFCFCAFFLSHLIP